MQLERVVALLETEAFVPRSEGAKLALGLGAAADHGVDLEKRPMGFFVHAEVDVECPRCGASPMATPGAGMRVCEYCGHEKKLEVALDTDALQAAREALQAARSGAFERFEPKAAKERLIRELFPKVRFVAGYLVVAALVSLGLGFVPMDIGTLVPVLLIVAVPSTIALPWLLAKSVAIANRLLPGVARYDALLRTELLRLLAVEGRMSLAEAAAKLSVSREHLEQMLHGLAVDGGAPVYWDHESGELLSLHAGTKEDSKCPACGGHLAVAESATMRCEHCGGELLGRMPPWAQAAAV